MRKLIFLALVLALVGGCKKVVKVTTNNPQQPQPQPQPLPQPQPQPQPNQPAVNPPTGVVINPNQGGGSGGAAQAVRKAARRARMQNDLDQLRKLMEDFELTNNRMPTVQELTTSLEQGAPNLAEQIREKEIVLTGIRQREGIWAYTSESQSTTGQHLVLSNSGIDRMTPAELNQRLKGQ